MKTPDSERDAPDDAWDDLFRQRLADHTDQPPANALNRILAGATPPRTPLYRRWVPVSIVLVLLVGAGGLFVRHVPSPEPIAEAVQPTKPVPQTDLTPEKAPADEVVGQVAAPESDAVGNAPARPVWLGHQEEVTVNRNRADRLIQPPQLAEAASKTPAGSRWIIPNYLPSRDLMEHEAVNTLDETKARTRGRRDRYTRSNRASRTQTAATQTNRLVRPTLSESVTPDNIPADESTRADGDAATTAGAGTPPKVRLLAVNLLASRPFHMYSPSVGLPMVPGPLFLAAPQASRPVRRPEWFVSITPLYNYQRISPIQTDAELVSDVRGTHSLASDRLGGRAQLGLEWPLMNRLSLRTSLVYQQVRQSLRYAVRSTQPDSVRVVVVDNQSVQLTPVFTRQNHAETTVWHYAGASADLAWQLNRRHSDRWQHSVTVGAILGRYTSGSGTINGFVQAAYSVERPLAANLHLRVEPTIQLGWQTLSHGANRFQSLPYSYGLALGLRFR
ncbi:MAG: hypothetical protein H7Z72_17470 [Bacteroidetes bacterium]|nr:hypothetical protein [Fibrella sp.]